MSAVAAQYKYKTYDTADACDTGNLCVGCSNMPYEKLNGTFGTGYQCIPVDKPCPGLSTMSDPKLRGAQVVVAPAFQSFIKGLIACANSQLGAKGGLNVQSTSRCGKSVGLTPAEVSDHQIGQAIDTNLYLNDSSPCDRDTCMRQGYCAYHPAALDCQNYPITQDKKTSEQVNNFLTCAGKINGLMVGADFKHGDWNHFESGTPTAAKVLDYQQQLKAFCQANPGCPGVTKVNPTNAACECYV
ncbi:MAG: hypothetical protein Q9201_000443 [Fulgogasparrea decipioides]